MSKPFVVMDAGRVSAEVDQVVHNLDVLRDRYVRALTRAVFEVTTDLIATAQKNAHVVTGDLRGSAVVQEPVLTETQVSCLGGFNKAYAAQRNFGGTITAKNAQMLAIPLGLAQTEAGASRYASPREVPGLFVLKLWGKVFLAQRRGSTARSTVLMFILKDSVTQKGDGFMTQAIEDARPTAAAVIAVRTNNLVRETA